MTLNCPIPNQHGINGTNPQQPSVPSTPTNQQKAVARQLNIWNSVSDLPLSNDLLQETVREITYRRELAAAVVVNPHAGRQKLNVVQRQIEMMLGNQDISSVNRFLTESRRSGENLFTALPLAADNLAVTSARLEYGRNLREVYQQFQKTLDGRNLTREQIQTLWIGFIEQGTTARFRNSNQYGKHARQFLQNEYNRFVDKAKELGIDKATFDHLTQIAEGANLLNDELLTVMRSVGLDVSNAEGIGFYHRDFSPDMRRRLRDRRADELLNVGIERDGLIRHTNTLSSRKTYDWVVEDDYRLAQTLGYTPNLSHSVDKWREIIDRSRQAVTDARDAIHNFNRKSLSELQSIRRSAADLQKQLSDNLEDFQRRLNLEMASKRQQTVNQFAELNRRSQNELDSMARRTAEIHDTSRKAFADAQRRLESEFNERLQEAQKLYQQKIEQFNSVYQRNADNVRGRLTKATDTWNARVTSAERKARAYREGLSEGRRGFNENMASLLDEKYQNIRREADEALRRARETAEASIQRADLVRKQKVEDLHKKWTAAVEKQNQLLEKQLDAAQRDIDRVLNEQITAHQKREAAVLEQMQKDGIRRDEALNALDTEYVRRLEEGRLQIEERLSQQRQAITNRAERISSKHSKLEERLLKAQQALDDNTSQFLSEMDEPIQKLYKVMDDERRILRELIDLPIEELDRLVDDGVLSKVPMTSERMFKVLSERYELPYAGLSEMLVTDPEAAFRQYERSLRHSLGNTNMARSMVQASVEEGWGVSRSAYQANPSQYKGYVNAYEFLERNGFNPDVYRIQGINDLYIPGDVAQHFAALIEVSTTPAHLSWFTQGWQAIARVTKQASLATTQFIFRNFIGSAIQAFSAGANMFNMFPALSSYVGYLRNGVDALDNTRRVFANGTMTLRDVVLKAKASGRLQSLNFIGEAADFMTRDSIRNRVWWSAHNLLSGKPLSAIGDAAKVLEIGTSRAISAALVPTVFFEDLMQLTTLMSYLRDGNANKVGSFLSFAVPKHFDNFELALKEMDRFFIQYDNLTKFDKTVSRNIAPFYTYVSRNIPMQLRNAIQNPGRFIAWYRLYGLMNRDAEKRGEDLPEGGIADWTADGMRIFIADPSGDDNKWYVLNTEYQDQIAEAFSLFAYRFTDPTSKRRAERRLPSRDVEPGWLNYTINSLHGHLRSFVALATRRDPFTRRDLTDDTSFLGYEVPEIAGIPPGVIRYVMENNIPFVRSINRSNPGGVFGVSEIRDEHGRVIREARRSMFGNATRTDRDWQITGDDSESFPLLRFARVLGFTLTENNIAKNMQGAGAFYRSAENEFKSEAGKRQSEAERTADPLIREQLINEYIVFMSLHYQAREAAEDVEIWLRNRQYPTHRQVTEETIVDVGSQSPTVPVPLGTDAINRALEITGD